MLSAPCLTSHSYDVKNAEQRFRLGDYGASRRPLCFRPSNDWNRRQHIRVTAGKPSAKRQRSQNLILSSP